MTFQISPPGYILSKLGIDSIDSFRKTDKTVAIERFFEPASKYVSALHGRKLFELAMAYRSSIRATV